MAFALITKGNSKLGPNIYHVDLPSGESCDGLTDWCREKCYTRRFKRFPSVLSKYADNFNLWRSSPAAFEAVLRADISRLKSGSVFRWHVSGDIPDAEYAAMIGRIAILFPTIKFYLYTRSYRVPSILPAIVDLETNYPNLKVWRSTDPSVSTQPGTRDARVFDNEQEARNNSRAVCPEQIGRKANCEECTLCFDIVKPVFQLAFIEH